MIGGLGSAVCDVLSEQLPTPVLKIGVNDVFGHSGPAVELIKEFGLDGDSIAAKVKRICKIDFLFKHNKPRIKKQYTCFCSRCTAFCVMMKMILGSKQFTKRRGE